jgi:hypothetical protein
MVMLAADQRAPRKPALACLSALLGLILFPGVAHAAPGDSATGTGTAEATVVERFQIVNDDDLRFGSFTRPIAAGTLSIDVSGTAVGTAGMSTTYTIPQTGTGRGPASFHLYGSRNRLVQVTLPTSFTITDGTATMLVDNLVRNASNNGNQDVRLNNQGYFLLLVGGRLNVAANQRGGTYSGTFDVTVVYQ